MSLITTPRFNNISLSAANLRQQRNMFENVKISFSVNPPPCSKVIMSKSYSNNRREHVYISFADAKAAVKQGLSKRVHADIPPIRMPSLFGVKLHKIYRHPPGSVHLRSGDCGNTFRRVLLKQFFWIFPIRKSPVYNEKLSN